MQTDHPLRKAHWLWPMKFGTPRNFYVQYRYDISLKAIPRKAPFFITADQCYMLYVNGQYVCRGPARGYQSSWPYDEVDLHPYLKVGHNWISARVYNAGIGTFQYLHQSTGGFLCAAKWGKVEIYSGLDWLERLEPGYRKDTARLSFQLNYQEGTDARKDGQFWITSARLPKGDGWAKPSICKPFGAMPWHDLEERGIPNLTNDILPYQKTASTSSGKCFRNWQPQSNFYVPAYAEIKREAWSTAKSGRRLRSGLTFMLPKAGAGRFVSVSADLGKPGFGTLIVEAEGAAGGETIDFFFSEGLFSDGRPIVGPKLISGCRAAMMARLKLRPGKTRHEFFQTFGHRYVVAIARETKKPIKLKLALRQTVYPLDIKGSFECDNPVLDDIYRICVQTQRVCSLDAYVDTPWREQTQWWGDARVQAQNTFHISGDPRLLKRGIRSIGRQEVPNGLTFGHAPTIAHSCILPDFSLIWVLTIWDYYFQTGDIGLFVEQWPRIQRLMGYFTGEGRAENGLLRYDNRYQLFLDWADIYRDGMPALLNMWYLQVLEKLVALAGIARMGAEKRKISVMYEQQRKLIMGHFWDSRMGLFRDGVAFNSKPVNRYSVHTQTLAILCGLQKSHHSTMVAKRLLPYLEGKKIEDAMPSSYWVTYIYEAMTTLGYGRQVVMHIEKNWSAMIQWGGTWETFLQGKPMPEGYGFAFGETSMSHAWAAHPIYHLVRTLGGITQTDVAWKRVRFMPTLVCLGIKRTKIELPLAQGTILSRWQKLKNDTFKVTLSLPDTVVADVVLPGTMRGPVKGKNKWIIDAVHLPSC